MVKVEDLTVEMAGIAAAGIRNEPSTGGPGLHSAAGSQAAGRW